LQRGITGASGVQLTPSELDAIRKSDPDAVLLCPDSNAILIRTAESGL
jgi:predicted  nucleic acid-binding Zn-ribbon protein